MDRFDDEVSPYEQILEFCRDLDSVLEETPLEEAKGPSKELAKADKKDSPTKGEAEERKKKKSKALQGKEKKSSSGRKRNPFKRRPHLGLGPRNKHHNQTKEWDCKCTTPYSCMCRSRKTGRRKPIKIKRDYKRAYNSEYKNWRKKQEH